MDTNVPNDARTTLQQVTDLISSFKEGFLRRRAETLSQLWSAYLDVPISPDQAAAMLLIHQLNDLRPLERPMQRQLLETVSMSLGAFVVAADTNPEREDRGAA